MGCEEFGDLIGKIGAIIRLDMYRGLVAENDQVPEQMAIKEQENEAHALHLVSQSQQPKPSLDKAKEGLSKVLELANEHHFCRACSAEFVAYIL